MRSNADNFTIEEIAEGVEFAKQYGAKIYVTTNIFAHNENMDGLEEYLKALGDANVAGIIVADPLIIETCRRVAPNVEVHLSTQQSLSNWKAVQFWKEEGLDRVVLARETSALEIREMKEKVDIEIESFIHGAMCIAYSGRCVLSNHMTARDSNRGGCCQSCRWDYDLYQTDGANAVALYGEEDAPFAMSPKDLKLIESIPKMIEMGIDSLKIEGRMKSIHYVATVVSVYRKVIDAYCADPDNFVIQKNGLKSLISAPTGTLRQLSLKERQAMKSKCSVSTPKTTFDFVGLVLNYDEDTQVVTLQQRNFFKRRRSGIFRSGNRKLYTHD